MVTIEYGERGYITYYIMECVEGMRAYIPDNFIDLTVTSPPYDNLRDYHGYTFDFEAIAQELWRVTKEGGVVVWVVGDATVNGSETGTSFKHALRFMEIGFNLHDTMIYKKFAPFHDVETAKRYRPNFEYMFIFSKGRIKSFNPICDTRNKMRGDIKYSGGNRKKNGNIRDDSRGKIEINRERTRNNIWEYFAGGNDTKHPAVFPEALAKDHILSWSNPGDLVLDPMCGSGTTLKMARMTDRNAIGFEMAKEYETIIEKRIRAKDKSIEQFF